MRTSIGIATVITLAAGTALAQDSNALSIEGEAMVTEAAAPAHMENVDTIYSGWRFRSTETQALETDDFDNPGMVFVDKGLDLWDKVEGTEGKARPGIHTARLDQIHFQNVASGSGDGNQKKRAWHT